MSREAMEAVQDHSQIKDHLGRSVFIAIARFVPPDGSEGYASVRTIADVAGCDKDTVSRWVQALEEAGELKTRKTGQGRGQRVYYTILLPFDKPKHGAIIYGDNNQNNVPTGSGDGDNNQINVPTKMGTIIKELMAQNEKLMAQNAKLLSLLPELLSPSEELLSPSGELLSPFGELLSPSMVGTETIETIETIETNNISQNSDENEKSDETQSEEVAPKALAAPAAEYAEFVKIWGDYFPSKPSIRLNNKTLQGKLKTRLKSAHFRDNWKAALLRASKSDFLKNSSWFVADWFLKNDNNYEKCLNGNYDNGPKVKAAVPAKPKPKASVGYVKELGNFGGAF